ncbi:MAG TPA: hypothetical protein VNW68_07970, partial [Candidatus Limnocylindria bacterium]|nr:hypothetical protein [Candidatus Limnocylindria bacterium]
ATWAWIISRSRICGGAADRFQTEVAPLAASAAPPQMRLREMIHAHVAVVTSAQRDAAVFLHEWRFLSDERRAQMADRRDAYEALFRQVIGDGVRTGDFAATDPKMAAIMILSALNGIASWYRPDGELSADQIGHQFADFCLRALGREAHFMTRTIT